MYRILQETIFFEEVFSTVSEADDPGRRPSQILLNGGLYAIRLGFETSMY